MKHADATTFEQIPALLHALRKIPQLRETRPGIFYLKSRAFLHFHDDPNGIFADVRLTDDFVRLPVTTRAQKAELMQKIHHHLSTLNHRPAERVSNHSRKRKSANEQKA